jgi:deoxyribodipyrimidine photolyase
MRKAYNAGLMWFRRNFRVDDKLALIAALQQCRRVFCRG